MSPTSVNVNDTHTKTEFKGSTYNLSSGYPVYSYHGKSLALIIDGHVKPLTVTHGSSIDYLIAEVTNFE